MWGAAIAAGSSLISGAMGWQASQRSAEQMEKMRELMRERLDFAKERYAEYKNQYGDVIDKWVADAMEGVEGDYEGVVSRAEADVEGEFNQQQEERRRRMQSMGLDPSSGRYQSSERQGALQEATASAMAQNRARERERSRVENQNYQRAAQVGQFGAGMLQNASREVQQAQSALGEAHGQEGQMQADLAGNLFASAGQTAGFAAGQMMDGGGATTTSGGEGMVTNNAGNAPTTNNFAGDAVDANPNTGIDFDTGDFNIPAGGRDFGAGPDFGADFAQGLPTNPHVPDTSRTRQNYGAR